MKKTHLSFQNSKSVDYIKFKTYLVGKDKLNKETTEFYKKETWRKMNFRQYSYGKKSIDNFLNKIQETFGSNILIGYGAGAGFVCFDMHADTVSFYCTHTTRLW